MTSYELSRAFFDFCFENPEKVSPNHHAIFFFAIEHCNRLGWKTKFGFPTQMAMDAIGIKKHQTYIKYFNDIVEWGFFTLIQRSTNQYSANIISLSFGKPKNSKSLGKAIVTHAAKQTEPNGQSNSPIIKPDNQITNNQITTFDKFWDLYGKKEDKIKCQDRFNKLNDHEISEIFRTLPSYLKAKPDKQYRKNPLTYLNGKCWNDEIEIEPANEQYVAPAFKLTINS